MFYFRAALFNRGDAGEAQAGEEPAGAQGYFRWMGCQEGGAPEARGEEALPGCEHYRD